MPVSVSLPGFGPMGASQRPSVSAIGRYVVFESVAPDLVLADTNVQSDVFITDRQSGQTRLVSVGFLGNAADGNSNVPCVSADGRYVAFASAATNLVPGDTNGFADVFLRDTLTNTTIRISVDSAGAQANNLSWDPCISADGKLVAFSTYAYSLVALDTNAGSDICIRDLTAGTTKLVSINTAGIQGTGHAFTPTMSSDGRLVAFRSTFANLVPGDTNGREDVFVRDRVAGITMRASVDSAGNQGNLASDEPSISSDGRFLAFSSFATNLVATDTNNTSDVFIRDLALNVTVRASVGVGAVQANAASGEPKLSGDGRYVTFSSGATNIAAPSSNGKQHIFLKDMSSGTVKQVSLDSVGVQATDISFSPSLSTDGSIVVFQSSASNLVSTDRNSFADIFARDIAANLTTKVSVDAVPALGNGGSGLASISADGNLVAFQSDVNFAAQDTNGKADIYLRDLGTQTTQWISVGYNGGPSNNYSFEPSLTPNGRYAVFNSYATNLVNGDSNTRGDVFVRDLQTQTTTLASVSSSGIQADGDCMETSISADGRYVVFRSNATNLVVGDANATGDIFLRDMVAELTTLVSANSQGDQANGFSSHPVISADGRYVAFESLAKNLVPGDTNNSSDVFVRDLLAGTTTRISVSTLGAQADSHTYAPSISANGRFVAFHGTAQNLVVGDTNGQYDVFVRDRWAGTTVRVSVSSLQAQSGAHSLNPKISADGRLVAFSSDAADMVEGDTNGASDAFVRDMVTGQTYLASVSSSGVLGNYASYAETFTADGRYMALSSCAINFTPLAKRSDVTDVFRHELIPPKSPVIAKLGFENWTAATPPATADYTLRTAGGTRIWSGTTTVAADGTIEVPRPAPGNCELLVKSWVFLQKKVSFTQSANQVDLGTISLTNGDCDGDNVVSLFDYLLLSAAFDSVPGDPNWNPRADLDGDNVVSLFDYLILSDNFDREGDL